MRIDGDTAIKKDIGKYFQLFWPQLEDYEKDTLSRDMGKIIDGTFDREMSERNIRKWKKECKAI